MINTGTTIITFLKVFLIQNTQNRDTIAIQLKLEKLIRATKDPHNALMDLEELGEAELEAFSDRYEELAAQARGFWPKAGRIPIRRTPEGHPYAVLRRMRFTCPILRPGRASALP